MAIVVEEEKDRGGVIVLIGWLVVVLTIILAVYFVFFQNPQIIDDVIPSGFKETAAVAKLKPKDELVNKASFSLRQSYVPIPGEGTVGKSNPFLP